MGEGGDNATIYEELCAHSAARAREHQLVMTLFCPCEYKLHHRNEEKEVDNNVISITVQLHHLGA